MVTRSNTRDNIFLTLFLFTAWIPQPARSLVAGIIAARRIIQFNSNDTFIYVL